MSIELTQLPSLILDSVAEDALDATQAVIVSGIGPFDISGDAVLTIDTDTTAGQAIVMDDVNFDDPTAATAAEIALVLNAELDGGYAVAEADGSVSVYSDTYGYGSELQVTAGGANTALGFPTTLAAGIDATTQVLVINRVPTDGEIEVATTASATFCIFSSDGAAPNSTDVAVTIDGVAAITAGVVQAGYTGGFTTVDPATLLVEVSLDAGFESQAITDVVVSVLGTEVDSYSFTIVDTTAPEVLEAVALDTDVVRITFNEAMDPDTLADTSVYTFLPRNTFSVTVTAASAVVIDAYSVDVTTDIPMTFGALYEIFVGTDALDARGNAIVDGTNDSVTFTAFVPDAPVGRRFQLWDWIPEYNKRQDATGDLRSFISILQEVVDQQLHNIDRMADILDPETAPEDVVDAMLVDLGNPFSMDLELADKRRLLRVLIEIYQAKGTAAGIIDTVNFLLGIEVSITPFTGSGWVLGVDTLDGEAALGTSNQRTLYSFSVTSTTALTADQRSKLTDIVQYMKGAGEHLARIIEPATQVVPVSANHAELGYSRLGINFRLH